MSNNQNVCAQGLTPFSCWPMTRMNYVSALWDLEYNYPIGSIQHRSHLNVWFIADWWLVYFDLQFNPDLCMFIWTIHTNPDFCTGTFYRQEMWLRNILSIVGILLKCKFSSFSTSINIRFIEETERGYTFNKKELPRIYLVKPILRIIFFVHFHKLPWCQIIFWRQTSLRGFQSKLTIDGVQVKS